MWIKKYKNPIKGNTTTPKAQKPNHKQPPSPHQPNLTPTPKHKYKTLPAK